MLYAVAMLDMGGMVHAYSTDGQDDLHASLTALSCSYIEADKPEMAARIFDLRRYGACPALNKYRQQPPAPEDPYVLAVAWAGENGMPCMRTITRTW